MMLRTLIVDDEPLAHKIILKYAEDTSFLEIVGQCYLATDALKFLKTEPVDLIFLDIQMPKLKGLEFLRILDKRPLVIITSAHQEYALESFELDVCDYLLKPFRFDRFLKATHKALELFQLKHPTTASPPPPAPESPSQIFIKSDKRFVSIEFQDILYLESFGNYVKVWLADQFLLTSRTLNSFEEKIPDDLFIRIHKSFIINKKQVHFLEGNRVMLKNGQAIPLSKNHRQAFLRFME